MNIKMKALVETATFVSLTFGGVALLNWLFPAYANMIIAVGLMAYLVYLVYEIRVSQLKFRQGKE
jgi:uncharacterized protein YhhL (DUF1145 family)